MTYDILLNIYGDMSKGISLIKDFYNECKQRGLNIDYRLPLKLTVAYLHEGKLILNI